MERALIIGASGGIGAALAAALRSDGIAVTELSRRADGLDVTDEASIDRGLAPLRPSYDLIFVATGALEIDGARPEKSLRQIAPGALAAQYAVNAIGPILLLKHCLRLLPRDRRAVFAALSARVGSIGDNGLGGWYAYRAAKAGLNQLMHTASIEVARTHPKAIVTCLHPGTVQTAFTEEYVGNRPTVSPQTAADHLLGVISQLKPSDTGGFKDWKGEAIPW